VLLCGHTSSYTSVTAMDQEFWFGCTVDNDVYVVIFITSLSLPGSSFAYITCLLTLSFDQSRNYRTYPDHRRPAK